MIRKLHIERFKSIREATIDCRRVNVFIGPPDTGKTNLLEALNLLSRFGWNLPIDSSMRLRQELGFDALFHRQFFDRPVVIEMELDPTTRLERAMRVELGIAGEQRLLEVLLNSGRRGPAFAFGGTVHVPELDWLRYYAFAGSEQWTYQTGFSKGQNIVAPPHAWNLTYIARHDTRAYDYLRDLVAGLGWKLRFDQTAKAFRMSEVRADEILDYNLDLLSDSLKRLFFYATIVRTSENATLVFDEPDVAAFPPYPKTLGDLIAADEKNQYFLTTHNPYFLASLVEKTPMEELAVFICSRDDEGGTSAARVPDERTHLIVEQEASVFFNLGEILGP